MQRDDGGGGGPFAYYPTSGDVIRETADEIGNRAGGIGAVRRQVEDAHRRALVGVGGDLTEPMADAPAAMTANADRVEQAAWFAAGVVRLFADAVDDYNRYATAPRSVDQLNLAYAEARLDDFGLDANAYAKGEAKADRDYDADWTAANADLLAALNAEYQRLNDWLDLRANQAARMLDRGPNPGDVTALWAAGALPPNATDIWPGLDLVEVPLLRLPYELRDDPGDRRSLQDMSQDELLELWEEYEFEPAREVVADQIVHNFENMTALRDFNLSINLAYMTAMSRGMPEWFARRMARAHPETLLDLLAPLAVAGKLSYHLTIGGLVEAVRDDPWSLRTLGEVAMVLPVGRVGKLRKVDELIDELDNVRDVERSVDAGEGTRAAVEALDDVLRKEHLRQLDKYGKDGFRVLENGRFRYYGDVKLADRPGEMIGRRIVREWNPTTGVKRTWHETIDGSGTVRIVRPEQGPQKTHYYFDKHGNYGGRR